MVLHAAFVEMEQESRRPISYRFLPTWQARLPAGGKEAQASAQIGTDSADGRHRSLLRTAS
jgi:hypothetical protein